MDELRKTSAWSFYRTLIKSQTLLFIFNKIFFTYHKFKIELEKFRKNLDTFYKQLLFLATNLRDPEFKQIVPPKKYLKKNKILIIDLIKEEKSSL